MEVSRSAFPDHAEFEWHQASYGGKVGTTSFLRSHFSNLLRLCPQLGPRLVSKQGEESTNSDVILLARSFYVAKVARKPIC